MIVYGARKFPVDIRSQVPLLLGIHHQSIHHILSLIGLRIHHGRCQRWTMRSPILLSHKDKAAVLEEIPLLDSVPKLFVIFLESQWEDSAAHPVPRSSEKLLANMRKLADVKEVQQRLALHEGEQSAVVINSPMSLTDIS